MEFVVLFVKMILTGMFGTNLAGSVLSEYIATVSTFRTISARGPLLLLGMSQFASHKMFAECSFSQGVIVFDYKASMFCICKNFARCTFSQRVIVFDYQASMFCVYKKNCMTYVVWMSHIIAMWVCHHDV